jgi:hypothetical protein
LKKEKKNFQKAAAALFCTIRLKIDRQTDMEMLIWPSVALKIFEK